MFKAFSWNYKISLKTIVSKVYRLINVQDPLILVKFFTFFNYFLTYDWAIINFIGPVNLYHISETVLIEIDCMYDEERPPKQIIFSNIFKY